MDKGKEVTLYILEQYRDHCQTTVNMGEDADKENLKEVKEAIKWVKALFDVSKECEHPYMYVHTRCMGEINRCMKCGEDL